MGRSCGAGTGRHDARRGLRPPGNAGIARQNRLARQDPRWGRRVHLDPRGFGGSEGSPRRRTLPRRGGGARWLAARGAGKVVYFGDRSARRSRSGWRSAPPPGWYSGGLSFCDGRGEAGLSLPARRPPPLDRFEAAERIRRVTCPITLHPWRQDSIAPFKLGPRPPRRAVAPRGGSPVRGPTTATSDVGGAGLLAGSEVPAARGQLSSGTKLHHGRTQSTERRRCPKTLSPCPP
jgi:hypothetical protein